MKDHPDKGQEEFSSAKVVSLSQKIICFGPHIIMWAGSFFNAKRLVRGLQRVENCLNDTNIEDHTREILESDIESLQLIYGYISSSNVRTWSYGCLTHESYGVKIICGGSGTYRLIDEFNSVFGDEIAQLTTTFRQMSYRISHMIAEEIHDPSAYWYGVGGGYEVVSIGDKGWSRVPYAVPMFSGTCESFGLSRIISYTYYADHLCIDLYYVESSTIILGDWPYIIDRGLKRVDRFFVRDFLNRELDLLSSEGVPVLVDGDHRIQHDALFNIIRLHRVESRENRGPAVWWAFVPSVVDARPTQLGFEIGSRAFFLREVEEWFIGRHYTPPDEEVENYREARAIWQKGLGYKR